MTTLPLFQANPHAITLKVDAFGTIYDPDNLVEIKGQAYWRKLKGRSQSGVGSLAP